MSPERLTKYITLSNPEQKRWIASDVFVVLESARIVGLPGPESWILQLERARPGPDCDAAIIAVTGDSPPNTILCWRGSIWKIWTPESVQSFEGLRKLAESMKASKYGGGQNESGTASQDS